jgi:hypothetical protein
MNLGNGRGKGRGGREGEEREGEEEKGGEEGEIIIIIKSVQ